MSSLQSPAAPDEPSPVSADSFEQMLAAERQSREDRMPDWPAWMAPAALFGGLLLAAVGGLFVDIPALALGANITSSHLPPGLEIADTVVQDGGFIFAAVFFAQLGGRAVHA